MEIVRHLAIIQGHVKDKPIIVMDAERALVNWMLDKQELYKLKDEYKLDIQHTMHFDEPYGYGMPITKFQITCFSELSIDELRKARAEIIG